MSVDVQQSVVAWKLQEQLIQGVGIIMSLGTSQCSATLRWCISCFWQCIL